MIYFPNIKKEEIKMKKGSILLLTLMAVLILSIMVTGLLTIGTTEIQTTQNYHLTKDAYYLAIQGVEEIRKTIADNPEFEAVQQISISGSSTLTVASYGMERKYITGTLKDMESGGSGVNLSAVSKFQLPYFSGFNLSVSSGVPKMGLWKLDVTSKISSGSKNTYSEVTAGIIGPFATDMYQ
jgi:hypothetical protein